MDWDERERRNNLAIRAGDTVRVISRPGTYRVEAAGTKLLHVVNVDKPLEKISVYKRDCVKDL
jgi:hypothetical protein